MSDASVSCQPLLDRLTHIMLKTGMMKKLMNFESLEEKIHFYLSDDNIKYDENTRINIREEISDLLQAFYSLSTKHTKSQELADQLKVKGSKAFMKKKDEEAFKFYTDGLRYAPDGSPLLAVLYANRSATHIQRKKYKECLEDIERAEMSGYPPEAQYKLYKRKTEALLKLGRKKEAQCTLLQAKGCVLPSGKDSFSNSLKELEEKIAHLKLEDDRTPENISFLPDLFKGDNEKQMSGALEIRVNTRDGRHVRAISNIPKGSALFREKPFAAILLPEYFLTHCQGCFLPLPNPIPCKGCCDVFWCGEKCRTEGEVFHKYECCNLHILSSVGIAHLSLRIVLIAGWPICQQVRREAKTGSVNEEEPSQLFYSRDKRCRYKAVFSLLAHLEKASEEDQFQYSLAGIILAMVIVERTRFLASEEQSFNEASMKENKTGIELSSLLVHHISQLVSNAHAITQIEGSSEGESSALSQIFQRRIASAIYPLASLMNHSCKPSIINCFQGDVLVIHSVEEIRSGDQLYNCYGPHACRQERNDRRAALERQYFFFCECTACTNDELLIKEGSWSGIKCPNCKGIAVMVDESKSFEKELFRCLQCKTSKSLPRHLSQKCSDANALYEDGQESFRNGKYDEAKKFYLEALRIGEEVFVQNNEFLNTARDNLAKTYTVEGQFEDALRELSLCLKIVEARFGENSVEVAHELLKYLDVIRMAQNLNSHLKTGSGNIRKRIKTIFTTHYGATWKNYLKLDGV